MLVRLKDRRYWGNRLTLFGNAAVCHFFPSGNTYGPRHAIKVVEPEIMANRADFRVATECPDCRCCSIPSSSPRGSRRWHIRGIQARRFVTRNLGLELAM